MTLNAFDAEGEPAFRSRMPVHECTEFCDHAAAAKRGRNNKRRAKVDERDVAALLGGKRHPADVGGPEDVHVDSLGLSVQVKGRAAVPDYLRDGLASARAAAAARTGWTGALVLVDRSGTRLRRYIVFDLEDFRAREGIQ